MTKPLTNDGFSNVITGLGTRADKSIADTYTRTIHNQAEIDAAFQTSTWFAKIVEIPVDDALREGWEWQADKEVIPKLEAEEKRLQLVTKLKHAMILARKDGGATLFLGMDTRYGAPDTPLDVTRLTAGALQYLLVFDRQQCTAGEIDREVLSPNCGKPLYYNYQTTQIHPSRIIRFIGKERYDMALTDGFGNSIYGTLKAAILAAEKTGVGVSHLINEAKIDILGIPNLTENLATEEYESRLIARVQMMDLFKSMTGTLLMDTGDGDSEGETHETKQINFSGLPEVLQVQLAVLAGASDIPATRLLGKSPDGMNSSGDGDLRNYYDMVAADQKLTLEPLLEPLFKVLIVSALGTADDNIWFTWKPLYSMSEKEGAEVEKIYADTVKIYSDANIIPSEVLTRIGLARMVESGQWPGIDDAMKDYAKEIEDLPLETETQIDPTGTPFIATDAAPRSLYVSRAVLNRDDIVAWAVSQGFAAADIIPDLHVTIMYSRDAVDWMKIGNAWEETLDVSAGGPRVVSRFNEYAVLEFNCSTLAWRHEEMKRAGAVPSYPNYSPHVSIVKSGGPDVDTIKPYTGKIMFGPEIFEVIKDAD